MNGGRKRRIPVTPVAAISLLVLAISAVTAQQVFNGNGQPVFIRQQPQFQPQFPQNRNFVLPSASPLRHRNLFTRQISHRHRPRQRSSSSSPSPTPKPSLIRLRVPLPSKNRLRLKSNAITNQQHRAELKSNISRRVPQQQFVPRMQPRPQQVIQVQRQPFRPFQQPLRPQTFRPAFVRTRPSQPLRAPLSPIPFGAVQRPSQRSRLPQNNMRLSLRPPTPPPTPPILTTTTPLPTSTSPAPVPVTKRPIRVQQVSLDLRRKPQMTRGQFRRIGSHRPSNFPHQPTHRVKPDRVTRPILEAGTSSTAEVTTTTTVATTTTAEEHNFKLVDDIEAAILRAVIDSSSPAPPGISPVSSTHRPRRIRPGHRRRTTTTPTTPETSSISPTTPTTTNAPLVSIEEAVLRAVLEATPLPSLAPEASQGTGETVEDVTEPSTTTPKSIEATTSLFPAFANRRQGHRRRTTHSPTSTTTHEASTTSPTSLATSTAPTTSLETTLPTIHSTEDPTTLFFSTLTTLLIDEPSTESTKTSEILPSTTEPTTTSEDPSHVTIAVPDEIIEDRPDVARPPEDRHFVQQIEQNVIAALSTPPTSSSPPSPSPPSPPAPPPPSQSPVGPPGSQPPSDDIVDELNGSVDFLQVAQRLHLLRRLLQ